MNRLTGLLILGVCILISGPVVSQEVSQSEPSPPGITILKVKWETYYQRQHRRKQSFGSLARHKSESITFANPGHCHYGRPDAVVRVFDGAN